MRFVERGRQVHGINVASIIHDFLRTPFRLCLGTPPSGPGHTGHVNDPESGLVYMQARYYDPAVGRFVSTDPVGPSAGDLFGFNRYAYADNSPIVHDDPTGAYSRLVPDDNRSGGRSDTGIEGNDARDDGGDGLTNQNVKPVATAVKSKAQQQGAQSSSHHKKKAKSTGLPQNGEASIYSDWFDGKTTASGETFSQNGYTAALLPKKRWHAVPLRTRVEITHGGRSVVVDVNDRGAGARDGSMTRVLDVTRAAASYLTGKTISNDNDSNKVGLISITITQVPNATPLGPASQEQK